MSEKICSYANCSNAKSPKAGYGYCSSHYKKWKEENFPKCLADGCEKIKHTKNGYCATHSARIKKYGSWHDSALQKGKNKGACIVEGCINPMRKTKLCASHYSQKRVTGEAKPFKYKWAKEARCIVCGSTDCKDSRLYCSGACKQFFYKYGQQAIKEVTRKCAACSQEIDLRAKTKAGHKKRFDTILCKRCARRSSLRHKTSISVVADLTGSICGICDKEVDMSLSYPDPLSASVDHILPVAHGGTHEMENLQIAHLWCNNVKSSRINFKL